jgi:polyhydroxyalkanoate synthesis regulator phasin
VSTWKRIWQKLETLKSRHDDGGGDPSTLSALGDNEKKPLVKQMIEESKQRILELEKKIEEQMQELESNSLDTQAQQKNERTELEGRIQTLETELCS